MSPSAVEARLKAVDELRELAFELSHARRSGAIEVRDDEFDLPNTSAQESIEHSLSNRITEHG